MRIRRLGPGDGEMAGDAVRTFKTASRTIGSLEAFLRNPANYLLVGEAAGRIAGFLTAHRLERADREACQMFVYEVGVAEEWRRHGVGTALLREIVALARAEGMFEAFVLTNHGNAPARRLYARTGGRVEDDSAIVVTYRLSAAGETRESSMGVVYDPRGSHRLRKDRA